MTRKLNPETDAWRHLEAAVVHYRGQPLGTVASRDPNRPAANYDHVFTRDFAVSALTFLMSGETEVVRNFLLQTRELQNTQKEMDCFKPGQGLMPASFKVTHEDGHEIILPDFGEHAIARVAPVDSGFWWLLLLHAYVRATEDWDLACAPETQRGIRYTLDLCLTQHFEMFPTMLVPDGSFMIDRRMGVYGHPIDIESLFFTALRAASELIVPDGMGAPYLEAADERLKHLGYHVRTYYWLDLDRINEIYRYEVEEFGATAVNKFNVYPDTIPEWLFEWMPRTGGYFAGNLGPGRIDYRVFMHGNLLAVLSGLADPEQCQAIMQLVEERWGDLVGEMPLKLCYPALTGQDWRTLTGSDPKNTPWSYHNGGSWPVMLWLLTAAAIKTDRIALARAAVETAEQRLALDHWPEYYDGPSGRFIGKHARTHQTWTAAGYLAARQLLENPDHLRLLGFEREVEVSACAVSG